MTRFDLQRCLTMSAWLAGTLGMPAAQADTTPAVPSPGQTYQLALEAQSAGEHADMLARFRQAAEGGHVGAQEWLALALVSTVHGEAVPADPCEAMAWARRAMHADSAVGRAQWEALGRAKAC